MMKNIPMVRKELDRRSYNQRTISISQTYLEGPCSGKKSMYVRKKPRAHLPGDKLNLLYKSPSCPVVPRVLRSSVTLSVKGEWLIVYR